ncbi:MAG TPA: hypothetical protein VGR30_06615 [Candidatus Binatia bacterium]|jgi:hypothetical protein|nr:hypothetical protein [Candidatus Binatia bacterium]
MKKAVLTFIIATSMSLILPCMSSAQQADAPVYKDGDWWRVKVDVARPVGVSVSGPQLGGFPEYIVRAEKGTFKVFGVRDDQQKELDGATLVSLLFGKPGWRGELLRFPIRVGLSWSGHFPLQMPGVQRQESAQYEVQSWEKVKTLKSEFEAFKIVMTVPERKGKVGTLPGRMTTYYYAPQVKAIVYLREESLPKAQDALTTSTLVDFQVSS